jgi:drug/metabolite transporter (DMT)-like permease
MRAVRAITGFDNRNAIFAWLLLLGFETLAQVALKAGGQTLAEVPFGMMWLLTAATSPWVLAGIAGYIGGFAAWMVILDRVPLSLGFPLTAVVMLAVTAASHYLFGENLTLWRMLGILSIVAGVVVMGGGKA